MKCAWQAYLNLLPHWMREPVDKLGHNDLQELRVRTGMQPELILRQKSYWLNRETSKDDLGFIVNAATKYSPWSASSISQGFITVAGGHRIGLCGKVSVHNNGDVSFQSLSSLCLRVAREFPGIADNISPRSGSILIIGKPGSGKTTLLRDIIRILSDCGDGSVAVVDERCEIFPFASEQPCFYPGIRTDVLSGCSKDRGIDMVLRTMGPYTIAVDEITAAEDCAALVHAAWCGVKLIATAHAENRVDLYQRQVYKALISSKIFDTLITLQPDKTWRAERMNP